MSRYIEADDSLVGVFLKVVEKHFPLYQNLKIKLIYDTKKRISKSKLVFASIESASEKIKFFSKDNIALEGYDYILVMDRKAWELTNDKDRERLIRHELRHIFVDDTGKMKLLGHDVEDFRAEIKLNADDPDWAFRLATLLNDVYEQEKEMAKTDKIVKHRGGINGN
jgi:hypothetical protein